MNANKLLPLLIIPLLFSCNKNNNVKELDEAYEKAKDNEVAEINTTYYLANPYIMGEDSLTSINETAEIILLIGEKNVKDGKYEEALFGCDSIYSLPREINENPKGTIRFPGLIEFTSDSKISKTSSADEANYWIGICYYRLAELTENSEEKVNNYKEAIAYLEKETNSETFNSFRHSQIGDIFLQLGDKENALKYYQESLDKEGDKKTIIRLEVLYKAAETAKTLEINELLMKYYQEIITDFPLSKYANLVKTKMTEMESGL